jgi:Flp pilus assembly protein TadD
LRAAATSGRQRPRALAATEETALAATRRQDWAAAAELWRSVMVGTSPKVPTRVFVQLGRAERRRGRLDEACRVLKDGLRHHPADVRLAHELAQTLAEQGWIEEALEQVRAARANATEPSSGVLRTLTRLLRRTGRLNEADETLRSAQAAAFDDDWVLRERAELASLDGRWAEAADLWRRIIADAPTHPPRPAFVRLSAALRRMGAPDEAARVIEQGLAAHPATPMMARERAEIAGTAGDWVLAAEWRQRAIKWSTSSPSQWHFELGRDLERSGRIEEAELAYTTALSGLASTADVRGSDAELDWSFRRQLMASFGGVRADPRLGVRVGRPASTFAAARGTGIELRGEVTAQGVRLWGTVPNETGAMELQVGGHVVRRLAVDRSMAPPAFGIHLKHSLLQHAPTCADLAVRPESAAGSAPAVGFPLDVPHGDGTLLRRLEEGQVVTKKGTLEDREGPSHDARWRAIRTYRQVKDVLSETCDVQLVLLYGTLLGCFRDRDLLPGDDDLDAGFVTTATSPEQARAQGVAVAKVLLDAGFDVAMRHGGSLLRVLHDGVDIDVYPIWFFDGRAWAYDAVPLRRDDYEPPRSMPLYGEEVLVPARPESVLAATYGHSWNIPDPEFLHQRSQGVIHVLRRTQLTRAEVEDLAAWSRRRHQEGAAGEFLLARLD